MARNALGKEVMNIQSGSGNTAAGSISSVTSTSRTGNGRAMRTATSQSNATARTAVSHAASMQNASTQNTGTQNGGKPASNSTSTANTSNTANGSKAASGANGSKGANGGNSSSSITDDPNWLPKLRKSISGWRQQLADAHHRWWTSRHDRGARNAARKDERTLQASIASANQFIDTELRSGRIRVGSKINTSA